MLHLFASTIAGMTTTSTHEGKKLNSKMIRSNICCRCKNYLIAFFTNCRDGSIMNGNHLVCICHAQTYYTEITSYTNCYQFVIFLVHFSLILFQVLCDGLSRALEEIFWCFQFYVIIRPFHVKYRQNDSKIEKMHYNLIL